MIVPFPPVVNIAKYGAPGSVLARSMRPDFAHGSVFCWLVISALTVPSPGIVSAV